MYFTNHIQHISVQTRYTLQSIVAIILAAIVMSLGSTTANAQNFQPPDGSTNFVPAIAPNYTPPQRSQCPVDVVMVLDNSGSMRGTPIVEARNASKNFIDQMDFSVDRVGLVNFNSSATFHDPPGLTDNSSAVKTKIDGLNAGGGTRIDLGITAATNALLTSPPNPGALPIIILLTDGRSDSASAQAAADVADAEGIRIIVIGLGSNIDTVLLRDHIATTPSDYYTSPTASQLEEVYNAILKDLCPTCTTPPDDMVAWYPFDNKIFVSGPFSLDVTGSPTAWDIYGLHHGIKQNSPTTAPGMVQEALHFNGGNQFVNVPHNVKFNFGTGDFSFDAWVRFPAGHSGIHPLLQKHNHAGLLNGYHWFVKDGEMALQMTSGGTTQVSFSGVSIPDDQQWHLLAVTVKRGTNGGRWSLDGAEVGTPFTPLLGSMDNNAPLQLGKYTTLPTGEYYLQGSLDEVEIFNRALGADELAAIHRAGEQGKCKDPCPFLVAVSTHQWNGDNHGDYTVHATNAPAGPNIVSTYRSLRDDVWKHHPIGIRYISQYELYSPRVTELVWTSPDLALELATTLYELAPGIQDLVQGQTQMVITQQMVDAVESGLTQLAQADADNGGGALAAMIEYELSQIELDALVGLDFEQAWQDVVDDLMSQDVIYVSSTTGGRADTVSFADEDILRLNPETGQWNMYFDGSDVGLRGWDVNAFHIMDNDDVLMSLNRPKTIDGVAYADTDIIRFSPTSYGIDTAGSFSMYLDGSDVSLTTSGEDIDAISFAPNGDLVISTLGTAKVGFTAKDEDMIRFTAKSIGNDTSGTWSPYVDGSDIGLTTSAEDISATWIDSQTGEIHLSTQGNYNIKSAGTSLQGDSDDIFICPLTPNTQGNTQCQLSHFWDGDANSYGQESVDGLSVRSESTTTTVTVTASSVEGDPGANDEDNEPDLTETQDDDVLEEEDVKARAYLPLINR